MTPRIATRSSAAANAFVPKPASSQPVYSGGRCPSQSRERGPPLSGWPPAPARCGARRAAPPPLVPPHRPFPPICARARAVFPPAGLYEFLWHPPTGSPRHPTDAPGGRAAARGTSPPPSGGRRGRAAAGRGGEGGAAAAAAGRPGP